MDDSDDDSDAPPVLIPIDEAQEHNKPDDSLPQATQPLGGKQFERQVPVTLITGYLGVHANCDPCCTSQTTRVGFRSRCRYKEHSLPVAICEIRDIALKNAMFVKMAAMQELARVPLYRTSSLRNTASVWQ